MELISTNWHELIKYSICFVQVDYSFLFSNGGEGLIFEDFKRYLRDRAYSENRILKNNTSATRVQFLLS